MIKSILYRVRNTFSYYLFKYRWRKKNRHNNSSVSILFPIDVVSVGKNSYGSLNVYTFGNQDARLSIGNNVSIANNVNFLLAGNHSYKQLSLFPFKEYLLGSKPLNTTKGPVIIEDDVWIGFGVIILSGIKVGQGSIIAAGSIVTRDVPPYSIVGGNPSKVIKYRFNPNIIQKLSCIDFSRISNQTLINNIDILSIELTDDNVDRVVKQLQNQRD